jgi:hypothetical protein
VLSIVIYRGIDLFLYVVKFWCEAYGQHAFVLNKSAPV